MAISLVDQSVSSTYNQLLHIDAGITGTRKRLYDGSGTQTPLLLGTTSIEVQDTLLISGIINLKEKSSAPSSPEVGDMAFISGDLYIAKQ